MVANSQDDSIGVDFISIIEQDTRNGFMSQYSALRHILLPLFARAIAMPEYNGSIKSIIR
jgi:hypothetical protein